MVDAVKLLKNMKLQQQSKLNSNKTSRHDDECPQVDNTMNAVKLKHTTSPNHEESSSYFTTRIVSIEIPNTQSHLPYYHIYNVVNDHIPSSSLCLNITLLEDPTGWSKSGTGATLWDCSISLTQYLIQAFGLSYFLHKRVIEIGSGLGLPSITLSILGSHCVASERELMIPLLRRNIHANLFQITGQVETHQNDEKVHIDSVNDDGSMTLSSESERETQSLNYGSVKVLSLDWDELPKLTDIKPDSIEVNQLNDDGLSLSSNLDHYELIIGSDLFFPANLTSWENIVRVFHGYMSSNKDILAFIAHEPRNPSVERHFFELLSQYHMQSTRVKIDTTPDDIRIYQLHLIS